jgi:hypothetical protein
MNYINLMYHFLIHLILIIFVTLIKVNLVGNFLIQLASTFTFLYYIIRTFS